MLLCDHNINNESVNNTNIIVEMCVVRILIIYRSVDTRKQYIVKLMSLLSSDSGERMIPNQHV